MNLAAGKLVTIGTLIGMLVAFDAFYVRSSDAEAASALLDIKRECGELRTRLEILDIRITEMLSRGDLSVREQRQLEAWKLEEAVIQKRRAELQCL